MFLELLRTRNITRFIKYQVKGAFFPPLELIWQSKLKYIDQAAFTTAV